jgi:ParB family chromosome partitioning protein
MSSLRSKQVDLIAQQFADTRVGASRIFGRGTTVLPKMVEAPVAELLPNPHQPRRSIDPQGITELASSIEQHGLLQPIVVRRREEDDRYEVVAGERRWRAFQHLGKESIPAILTTGDAEELALIENLQREDLHPLDEAIALERLKERHGYTHETLAKSIGRSRSVVTETLQLNTLPKDLQEEARRYPVTRNALVQMVRIADPRQREAAWEAIKQGASMRQIRAQRVKRSDAKSEPADRIVTLANRLLRDLEAPPAEIRASLSAEQGREVLLRLRAHIDALLGT